MTNHLCQRGREALKDLVVCAWASWLVSPIVCSSPRICFSATARLLNFVRGSHGQTNDRSSCLKNVILLLFLEFTRKWTSRVSTCSLSSVSLKCARRASSHDSVEEHSGQSEPLPEAITMADGKSSTAALISGFADLRYPYDFGFQFHGGPRSYEMTKNLRLHDARMVGLPLPTSLSIEGKRLKGTYNQGKSLTRGRYGGLFYLNWWEGDFRMRQQLIRDTTPISICRRESLRWRQPREWWYGRLISRQDEITPFKSKRPLAHQMRDLQTVGRRRSVWDIVLQRGTLIWGEGTADGRRGRTVGWRRPGEWRCGRLMGRHDEITPFKSKRPSAYQVRDLQTIRQRRNIWDSVLQHDTLIWWEGTADGWRKRTMSFWKGSHGPPGQVVLENRSSEADKILFEQTTTLFLWASLLPRVGNEALQWLQTCCSSVVWVMCLHERLLWQIGACCESSGWDGRNRNCVHGSVW